MEINYQLLNADSDAEIQQWLELFRLCFQNTSSRRYWEWLHLENPFYTKTKPLVLVAEINNRIVGSVSLIPSRVYVNVPATHSLLNTCLVHAAMVHPALRRQGIFSSLLENAIKLTKDEDYNLLLVCASNLHSYQGLEHAGFHYVTEISKSKGYFSMDRPFKTYFNGLSPHLRKLIEFPVSRICIQLFPKITHNFSVYYGDLSEFIDEINKIHTSNPDNSGVTAVRTPLFMRWRFSSPGFHCKCLTLWDGEMMIAYLILDYPEGGKNALIEDLYARKDDDYLISILVSEAVALLKKDNIDSIWTYLIEKNGNRSRIFSLRHGFIPRPSGTNTLPTARFLYYPLKENPFNENFLDKKQWNLQSADTSFFEKY